MLAYALSGEKKKELFSGRWIYVLTNPSNQFTIKQKHNFLICLR